MNHAKLGHSCWMSTDSDDDVTTGELFCEDCDYRTTDPKAIAEHFNELKEWYEVLVMKLERSQT